MRIVFAIGLLSFVTAYQLFGQDNAKKIKESRDKTLQEIEYANKLLIETQGKTKESLNEVTLINHKLNKRKEYLVGVEVEMSVLDQAIEENQLTIYGVEKEIERLKQLYAKMILNGYKNQSRQFGIMYFLASENMNQLYRRIRTIKLFNSYLKKKHAELNVLKADYLKRNVELERLKGEKDILARKAKKETLIIQQEVIQKKNLCETVEEKAKRDRGGNKK